VLLAALSVWVVLGHSHGQKRASAIFSEVVQLYPGDQVKMLGVPVGRVTALTPSLEGTRVDFVYDATAPVPAEASAVIVAPSLVTGRYVQLAPAGHTGPRLADGAVIPLARTAVPVEFDQLKKQLNELTGALGPDGLNSKGALSRAISTASANLAGNGQTLNETAVNLARAVGTLSDGREDLFGTVRDLATLVSALRAADQQVAPFTERLASVSEVLARSGDDTQRMLATLDSSVDEIATFVKANHNRLGDGVEKLTKVTRNVADNRQALADALQKLPGIISSFGNIYDPFTGAVTGGLAPAQFQDLPGALCSAFLGQNSAFTACRSAMSPAKVADLSYPPVAFNSIQRNGSANCIDVADATPPDPHPELHKEVDIRDNKPNLGYGMHPQGARCREPSSSDTALNRLLVPTGAPR
jgi:phospholipid/cholesterol/gamma-HCH transport system substrate-binding protein